MTTAQTETYTGKAECAAYLERRGIAFERFGNRLFAKRPMPYTDQNGEVRMSHEQIEVRTMAEARAVDKLIG